MVSPLMARPSESLTVTAVTILMRTWAQLLHLARDGGADAEHDDVEEAPDAIHDHGAGAVAIPDEEARDGHQQAEEIEEEQHQKGLRDLHVEEAALDDAALGRDVELAQLGIDERHHGGQQDVGREHGLVDLVPEGVAMLALDARVGDVRERKMRQRVSENRGPVAGHVGVREQQIDQRRGEEDQPRQRVEEVRHGVEVAEALGKAELGGEERIVGAQDLDHAARPADALADVGRKALGSQAGGLRDVDVGRVPAVGLHAQRGVRVFGDGFDGDAADFVESFTAQYGAGAAEEGGVPEVVAVLNDAVEELVFVGDDAELFRLRSKGSGE
jgi:hypothetical protein